MSQWTPDHAARLDREIIERVRLSPHAAGKTAGVLRMLEAARDEIKRLTSIVEHRNVPGYRDSSSEALPSDFAGGDE